MRAGYRAAALRAAPAGTGIGILTAPMAVHADPLPQDDQRPPASPAGSADGPVGEDALATRQLFLHRRIVTISPRRIEIRPPKSTMLLPLVGSVLMSALLAAAVVWIDSLPFLILPLILLASVVVLPLSGMTLVYAIFGANIVADRAGQNVSVKQRFLGLGVGTTELIPFWKIREFVVEDVGPRAGARPRPGARPRDRAVGPDAGQEERQAHPPGRLQPAA